MSAPNRLAAAALRDALIPAPSAPVMIPGISPDGSLFPIEKMAAHEIGQLHLAISAFVFSGEELLIQRRAFGKYHCGGQWANTCCTHPHWGESVESAAGRRLHEELGFTLPLERKRIVEYRAAVGHDLVEHERVHMFVGHADRASLVINPDADEVSEVRWVDALTLRSEMATMPQAFTPWFRIYLEQFPDLVI